MAGTSAIPDTVLPNLPIDVLMEILSLLPAKSLLRFMSVCKHWCSLIQNPSFVSNHHNRSKSGSRNESLLVLRSLESRDQRTGIDLVYTSISISFVDTETLTPFSHIDMDRWSPSSQMIGVSHYGGLRVSGHCNGIICLTDTDDIILSNPATREFKTLSLLQSTYLKDTTVGFGYDHVSDDYKVVRMLEVYDDPDDYYSGATLKTEIYNLSTDSWRVVDAIVPVPVFYCPSFELFYNGAFHWYGLGDSISGECIVSFDMKDEVFRRIEFPQGCFYANEKSKSLSVWNNFLALILYSSYWLDMNIEIWVMKEYGVRESWTEEFNFGPLIGINGPLGIWKDSELLLQRSNGQLASVNLHNHEIKDFNVHGVPETLRALPYTESLVSINKFTQVV